METQDDSHFTVWLHDYGVHKRLSWVDGLTEMGSGSPSEVLQCLGRVGSPSQLAARHPRDVDLCVFRTSIVPMWEDSEHAGSGKVGLKIHDEGEIDAIWIRTLMMLFYRGDMQLVSGVYLRMSKARSFIRISLWLRGPQKSIPENRSEMIKRIAESWQASLGLKQGLLDYMQARAGKGPGKAVPLLKWCAD